MFGSLGPGEQARQLRDPEGDVGVAVADWLAQTNAGGNTLVVAQLGLRAVDRVLEVGCGLAAMAPHIVSSDEGIRYVGLDRSRTMVDAARERHANLIARGAADFVTGDAEAMPFVDRAFTKVFSVGVMHFWEDPVIALSEVARVMEPGGIVVMGGLGPSCAPTFATAENGFHLFGADQWETFCEAAGFRDVRVASMGGETGPQLIQVAGSR